MTLWMSCGYGLLSTVRHIWELMDDHTDEYSVFRAVLETLKWSPLSLLMVIVPAFVGFMLSMLLGYHVTIMIKNMTTHEALKRNKKMKFHPY